MNCSFVLFLWLTFKWRRFAFVVLSIIIKNFTWYFHSQYSGTCLFTWKITMPAQINDILYFCTYTHSVYWSVQTTNTFMFFFVFSLWRYLEERKLFLEAEIVCCWYCSLNMIPILPITVFICNKKDKPKCKVEIKRRKKLILDFCVATSVYHQLECWCLCREHITFKSEIQWTVETTAKSIQLVFFSHRQINRLIWNIFDLLNSTEWLTSRLESNKIK